MSDNREQERPEFDDAEPMRQATETPVAGLHPSRIFGARIALLGGDSAEALRLLGNSPPRAENYAELLLRQRWHHLRSEVLITEGRFDEAEANCLGGLRLYAQHGQYAEDQDNTERDIYMLAFTCTLAEVRRRNGKIDRDTIAMLARELQDVDPTRDFRFLALQHVGFRTLALYLRGSESASQFRKNEPGQLLIAMSDSVLEEFNLLTKGITPQTATAKAKPAAKSHNPSVSVLISSLIDLPYPSELEDVNLPSLKDYRGPQLGLGLLAIASERDARS